MAANVINSQTAIDMSIHVVRAFVRARRFVEQHKDLAYELEDLKRQIIAKFGEYDEQFRVAFATISRLIEPLESQKKRKIGFRYKKD
jgi:hypothetical protein